MATVANMSTTFESISFVIMALPTSFPRFSMVLGETDHLCRFAYHPLSASSSAGINLKRPPLFPGKLSSPTKEERNASTCWS
jgi:hypothetical protein